MHARSIIRVALVALGPLTLALDSPWVKAADCASIAIINYPQSLTVLENCPATFSVEVTGTGPHLFQWFRDGQEVSGATNSRYTIPHVSIADSGGQYRVTAANACSQAVSSEAYLQVSPDVVPPRLLRVRGDATLERLIVTFAVGGCSGSPGLDPSSAQDPFNYSVSGGIMVSNAQLEASGTNVVLTTSRQTPNTYYTLRVEGVTDLSGNMIAPAGDAAFQSWVVVDGTEPKVVPPPVTFFRSWEDIWITWPYGSFLQFANDIAGPWHTLLNADFPYRVTVTPDSSPRFYRAMFDP